MPPSSKKRNRRSKKEKLVDEVAEKSNLQCE
jgi:hypothetical protein